MLADWESKSCMILAVEAWGIENTIYFLFLVIYIIFNMLVGVFIKSINVRIV